MKIEEFSKNENINNWFSWYGFGCAIGVFIATCLIVADLVADKIIKKKKREAAEETEG